MEIRAKTATEALPLLARAVMDSDEVGSRNGRTRELLYPHVVLSQPWRREILTPGRRASLPAQIAETMWVLAGRNHIEWLSHYLPRAVDYSDDGQAWRGGYGPRIRGGVDQLAEVVDLLRADPLSRRAVMSIYDGQQDFVDSKDIPCNLLVHFQSRLGYLHTHVVIRSNDLIWGWSGINAFEWSAVQEIVAGMLGLKVGEMHFSISSLHVYEQHWDKAERLGNAEPAPILSDSPRFEVWPNQSIDGLDSHLTWWFRIESQIRSGDWIHAEVAGFPEPMMRSWLRVLEWWWTKDETFLEPLAGTRLHYAAMVSP